MPVTAKLSRRFYERLGDEATNELVDWLNAVDDDYRSQLCELNERNFARFDAKLEQRFAEAEARTVQRFAEAEAKTAQRFAEAEMKTAQRFAEAEMKTAQRFAEFEHRLTRWMFTFWAGQLVALGALFFAVLPRR